MKRAKVSLIYARSENRCIGIDGGLPWRLPDEFRHFKRTTLGCPVIMGRKTFEDHNSVLPGRENVVLTRQRGLKLPEGVLVRHDFGAVLEEFSGRDEVFIIGGAGLFERGFEIADRVYETVVHTHVAGDTFLPAFDLDAWTATEIEQHPADDRHAHAFTITRYDRDR